MSPVTGVISSRNVAYEYVDTEICLSCDPFYYYFDRDICPDCMMETLEEMDEDSDFKICRECQAEFSVESLECFDHEKLIGDWKIITSKDGKIQYEPDETGEFSAIVTDSTFNCIQVVWSKYTTKVRAWCSPCFPHQADLDSGEGEIECYTLPEDLILKEEE